MIDIDFAPCTKLLHTRCLTMSDEESQRVAGHLPAGNCGKTIGRKDAQFKIVSTCSLLAAAFVCTSVRFGVTAS